MAVAVLAVGVTRLAAGRLRVGLGRTLTERCRLTLARANGLVEPPGQRRDLGFEFGDTLEEIPAAGTRGLVHAAMLPGQPALDRTGVEKGAKQVPRREGPAGHPHR